MISRADSAELMCADEAEGAYSTACPSVGSAMRLFQTPTKRRIYTSRVPCRVSVSVTGNAPLETLRTTISFDALVMVNWQDPNIILIQTGTLLAWKLR